MQTITNFETEVVRMCDSLLRVKDSNADTCGYKLKFFTKDMSILEPLVCKNCNGIYQFPTILPCNHWFCRSCIRSKSTCPHDENAFRIDDCYTIENLQQTIQAQPVKCVNFNKGCNWKGELRNIYKHYTICQHSLIKCRNNCGITLQINEMSQHENFECQLRSLKCTFCCKSMLARDMYNHDTSSCKKYSGETFWKVKVEKDGKLEVSESCRVNYSNYTMKYYPRKKVVISDEPPQVSTDAGFSVNKIDSLKRLSNAQDSIPIKKNAICTTDTVKKVQCVPNNCEEPAVVFTYCDTSEYGTDTSSECSSVGPMPRTLTRAEMKQNRNKSEKIVEINSEDSGFSSSQDGKSSPTLPEAKPRKKKFFKSSAFAFLNKNSKSSWGKKKEMRSPEKIKYDYDLEKSLNGEMEWKIKDISELLKRERTCIQYSPPFYTSDKGYKACIRAHFGNGAASFYVCLLRGENDKRLKWPFKGQCNLKVGNLETGHEFQSKQHIKGDIPGAKMPKKSNNLCSLNHYICNEETLGKLGVYENDCLTVVAEIRESTAFVYTKNIRKEDIQVIPREIQSIYVK